jgi:hypothetical protein
MSIPRAKLGDLCELGSCRQLPIAQTTSHARQKLIHARRHFKVAAFETPWLHQRIFAGASDERQRSEVLGATTYEMVISYPQNRSDFERKTLSARAAFKGLAI